MNNIDNLNLNDFNQECGLFQFREGDTIVVITPSGATFTGTFIRIVGNFLLWVRIINGVPRITLTGLANISISKI